MGRADLSARIQSEQATIDSCYAQIRHMKSKQAELDDLLKKVTQLQNDFFCVHQARTKKLNSLELRACNKKITNGYTAGMRGMLNGGDYKNAVAGLDSAKSVIRQKYAYFQDKIEQLQRTIAGCQGSLSGLFAALSAAVD